MTHINSSRCVLFFAFMFALTTSTILITSPAINPLDDSKIPYSYANIGTIPYGKTLTFDLVERQDLDLCKTPLAN